MCEWTDFASTCAMFCCPCTWILGVSVTLSLGHFCHFSESSCEAQSPGDIIIGVLKPCHSTVQGQRQTQPQRFTCSDFDLIAFLRSLAIIHTINTVNGLGFLPGVRLGYCVHDTCSNVMKALQSAEHMLSINGSLPVQCDYSDYLPQVKAVIGERYSELSIPLARLLGLYMVPQISCTSSSSVLSDKFRFPSFLRTIPSDVHQTKALTKLMSYFNWNWVGVVVMDDEYGKAALQSFLQDAKKDKVCVAYLEILPFDLGDGTIENRIEEVSKYIRSNISVQVVLLILKPELVVKIFQEMIRTNTSRVWIASDSWSMSRPIANMEGFDQVGNILGFTFITGEIPGFEEYLKELKLGPEEVNRFIEEYKKLRFDCTPELLQHRDCLAKNPPDLCPRPSSLKIKSPQACNSSYTHPSDDFLLNEMDVTQAYSERVAVWAIAHALKELLRCDENVCTGEKNFPPWKLLQELKKINFSLENRYFSFDASGDMVHGYDLIIWKRIGEMWKNVVVGRYRALEGDVKISNFSWGTLNYKAPSSTCSKMCFPGTVKVLKNSTCCNDCQTCPNNTFSDMDWENCLPCPKNTWSKAGDPTCTPRVLKYLSWGDTLAIALLVLAGLGELLLIVTLITFFVHREHPAVNVADGKMTYVMIAGLILSLASVFLFMGEPNDLRCRARLSTYGLGFTLSVACILVKSFRTYLVFLFEPNKQHRLKKFYNPCAIVCGATGVQVLICIFWLIFGPPKREEEEYETTELLIECIESRDLGFSITLAYVGLLAFSSVLLAFKGRKAAGRYTETGYIMFSMLIYLFVWACFIPIYVTIRALRSAGQASAVLVSSFGVILCHCLPSLYSILFKRDTENLQAHLALVRQAVEVQENPAAVTHNPVTPVT